MRREKRLRGDRSGGYNITKRIKNMFCPSVFLYLASIVPAIWLLELDKVDRRLKLKEEFNLTTSLTTSNNLKDFNKLIGVEIRLPEISLTTETWITLIEQFLMLILIIGRWMLPKGDLTRDQLSQLLLVYIGTAADIIEFFDSFKDDRIAAEPILVLLTLAIWSWSLMQFTVVLTATKARKSRLTTSKATVKTSTGCCSIDVWGIALNITLQDAPFLAFRLLIITHFNIISYMNVFFTCKNTLVILLQLYRLYVVYSENRKIKLKEKRQHFQLTDISIISKTDAHAEYYKRPKHHKENHRNKKSEHLKKKTKPKTKPKPVHKESSQSSEIDDSSLERTNKNKRKLKKQSKKDTGYSTCSSSNDGREGGKSRKHKEDTKKCAGKKPKRSRIVISEDDEESISTIEDRKRKIKKQTSPKSPKIYGSRSTTSEESSSD